MTSDTQIPNIKILFIGASKVGKTSLIERYRNNTFNAEIKPTVGINYHEVEIELKNKKFNIQLFDISGDDKYYKIITGYLKNAHGVFLVYDVTDKESFEQIKIWMKKFQDANKNNKKQNTIFVLLGNKIDIKDEGQNNEEDWKIKGEDYNMTFYETSASNGQNIKEAVQYMVEEIYKLLGENTFVNENDKEKENVVSENSDNINYFYSLNTLEGEKEEDKCSYVCAIF